MAPHGISWPGVLCMVAHSPPGACCACRTRHRPFSVDPLVGSVRGSSIFSSEMRKRVRASIQRSIRACFAALQAILPVLLPVLCGTSTIVIVAQLLAVDAGHQEQRAQIYTRASSDHAILLEQMRRVH